MINMCSGEIIIGDNLVKVSKHLNEQTFLASKLFEKVIKNYKINGWIYYLTEIIDVLGTSFMLTFVFKDSKLDNISLKHFGTIEEKPFDEENEIKRQKIHSDWLKNIFGDSYETHIWGIKYEFKWGEVTSNFDPRSMQSGIYLRYKKVSTIQ